MAFCENVTCDHNATSITHLGSDANVIVTCNCPENCSNIYCEHHVPVKGTQSDVCTGVTCHNGGSCVAETTHNTTLHTDDRHFYCGCLQGFTGDLCETTHEKSPHYNDYRDHNNINVYANSQSGIL